MSDRTDHVTSESPASEATATDRTRRVDPVPSQRATAASTERTDVVATDRARDKFGGLNTGASFFGWLVAVALSVLLTSVVGAIAAAVGSTTDLTLSEAERATGTVGFGAAVVLVVVLTIGYYAGGYVAGRMSRFDGGVQGVGVWGLGVAATVVALVLGAVFGDQYNLLDRVDLPRIPGTLTELGWSAVLVGLVALVATLLAAVVGGKVGTRYHHRVDRLAAR